MDIDLTLLRALEREKEISFDILVDALEQALLTADHKTGRVTVLAAEVGEDGEVLREYDDTPEGFGRIAATTAKQVILQRLRDAESELSFGEYAGREGDVVSGFVQQAGQR